MRLATRRALPADSGWNATMSEVGPPSATTANDGAKARTPLRHSDATSAWAAEPKAIPIWGRSSIRSETSATRSAFALLRSMTAAMMLSKDAAARTAGPAAATAAAGRLGELL